MPSHVVRFLGIAGLLCSASFSALSAQSGFHPRWEIPGFDLRKDGAWRVRARQVAQLRRQALREGRLDALNAPLRARGAGPVRSSMVVSGTITVPTLFFTYSGVAVPFDTAQYRSVLFETTPPSPYGFQNPYTLRTFYDQMSNSFLDMQGSVMGWVTLPNPENSYTGNPGTCAGNPFGTTNCNGLFSSAAINAMQSGMRAALGAVDGTVNFAQFDNDGPDLIPNTADDDGYVDIMMFAHATQDGACGGATNNHIWAHRFHLGATGVYTTNDASNSGDEAFVRVGDYFAQSAVGGPSSCDPNQIMPIGTAAHEFGHALGLPDFYDTGSSTVTEGIGRWGLMGSGNFSRPISPARMEAWSLSQMGWVTVVNADTTGTYTFGPAPTADTAFLVNVAGSNPRNERFLIENRQSVYADTALLLHACVVWHQNQSPPPCPGGLLIWHIDGTKISQPGNSVNVGSIHGLKLEEADGARDLWCENQSSPLTCNRGDAGDQFPGQANNTHFGYGTNPPAVKNSDGSFVGFAIDQITQVVPNDRMSFRLRFGALTVVRASDTAATIQFDAAPYNVFRDLLDEGSNHTVSFPDPQVAANGRTRWNFASWSDGGAITHTIAGHLAGGTLTANVNRDFKLIATAGTGGSVQADTAIDLTGGTFIREGRSVTLTATPDAGQNFGGWSGDTVTTNAVVALPMGRPYTVFATFAALAISSGATRPNGLMGAAYTDTLRATGGTGTSSWTLTGGALPLGLTLDGPSGIVSGFLRETGDFSYTATVTSGAQSQNRTFTFSVTAPTLATASVTTQLLGPTAPLNADQVRYLDFLGNNNGSFDVGDFLAWVKLTGAPPSPPALASEPRRKGGPQ